MKHSFYILHFSIISVIIALILPNLIFSQESWESYRYIQKLKLSIYQAHIRVKSKIPPESYIYKRKRKLLFGLFSYRKKTTIRVMKLQEPDSIFISITEGKKEPVNCMLEGELYVNFYLGGFGAPRMLTIDIPPADQVVVTYGMIKKIIEEEYDTDWKGNSLKVMLGGITFIDKSGRRLKEANVGFMPYLSVDYRNR